MSVTSELIKKVKQDVDDKLGEQSEKIEALTDQVKDLDGILRGTKEEEGICARLGVLELETKNVKTAIGDHRRVSREQHTAVMAAVVQPPRVIPAWFFIILIAQMVLILALVVVVAKNQMDFSAGGTHLTVGASSGQAPPAKDQEIPPVGAP
mgnify:CR=1 FL=1